MAPLHIVLSGFYPVIDQCDNNICLIFNHLDLTIDNKVVTNITEEKHIMRKHEVVFRLRLSLLLTMMEIIDEFIRTVISGKQFTYSDLLSADSPLSSMYLQAPRIMPGFPLF